MKVVDIIKRFESDVNYNVIVLNSGQGKSSKKAHYVIEQKTTGIPVDINYYSDKAEISQTKIIEIEMKFNIKI